MVASSMFRSSVLIVLGVCVFSSWLASASPAVSNEAKRAMDMDTNGFYGDTFNSGFGSFETVKRMALPYRVVALNKAHHKRMDMGLNGFHGDTFSSGFGDFSTAKRKRLMGNSDGFYGDTFSQGFGDFATAKKKKSMGMNSFHGDTFSQGFGDFATV